MGGRQFFRLPFIAACAKWPHGGMPVFCLIRKEMMSEQKSNVPIIIGAVALLVTVAGAGFYFVKDSGKDAVSEEAQVAAPANASSDAPVSQEEADAVSQAAASTGAVDGVEVKPGNPVVATVDGKPITRVDVFRYIKMMPAQVQQMPPASVYPLALDQVINTRLVQNKAESAGLENDAEVQQQLDMAKQQIIRTVFVQREVDKLISESDIKSKYNDTIGKQPAIEELKASHILVDSEAKAKELIAKLSEGADFAKLAAENSGDPGNKDKGGDLGWFAKSDMVPEFSEAAFKIAKGSVGASPIQTQFGWHVVKVEDKRERPKPTYEEVKPMIQVELRREKLEKMLDGWKKTANVEKFDINGNAVKEQSEVAPAAGETSAPAPAAE
jgi:peptidyl-prolyl cis-trans isomerase C